MRRQLAFRFSVASALLGALVVVIRLSLSGPAAQPTRAMTVNRQWLASADWSGSSKSVSPAGGAQGDIVTYTLHIVKSGPASTASVIVNDPLPPALEFIPPLQYSTDVPLVVGQPSYANHTVVYEGNLLEAWSEMWITVTLRVLADTGVLTNSLFVYAFSGDQPVVRSVEFYVTPATPTQSPTPTPTETPTPTGTPTPTSIFAPPLTETPTSAPPPPLPPAPSATAAGTSEPTPTATASPTPSATPTLLPTDTLPGATGTPADSPASASATPADPGGLTYDVSAIRPVENGLWGVALCATNPTALQALSVRLGMQIDRGMLIQIAYPIDARVIARGSGAQLAIDTLPAGQRVWLAAFVESADRPAVTAQVESSLGASRRAADPACAVPAPGSSAIIAIRPEQPDNASSSDAASLLPAGQAPAMGTHTPGPLNLIVPVMRDAGLPLIWLCGGGIVALLLLLAAVLLLKGRRRSDATETVDILE